jgi:hypothetical protein
VCCQTLPFVSNSFDSDTIPGSHTHFLKTGSSCVTVRRSVSNTAFCDQLDTSQMDRRDLFSVSTIHCTLSSEHLL